MVFVVEEPDNEACVGSGSHIVVFDGDAVGAVSYLIKAVVPRVAPRKLEGADADICRRDVAKSSPFAQLLLVSNPHAAVGYGEDT